MTPAEGRAWTVVPRVLDSLLIHGSAQAFLLLSQESVDLCIGHVTERLFVLGWDCLQCHICHGNSHSSTRLSQSDNVCMQMFRPCSPWPSCYHVVISVFFVFCMRQRSALEVMLFTRDSTLTKAETLDVEIAQKVLFPESVRSDSIFWWSGMKYCTT